MISENSIEEIPFHKKLSEKIYKTYNSRFNSSNHYRIKHNYSSASISFLSSYVIIINVLQILELIKTKDSVITFLTISFSILILVFSLLENSKEYKLLSSRLHNSGKEMLKVYNELQRIIYLPRLSDDEKNKKYFELSKEYDFIISRYQENHSKLDYELFLATKTNVFANNKFNKNYIIIKSILFPRWAYLLLILGAPIVFIIWIARF